MRAFLNADGHTPALEFSALLALVAFVGALQLSIAVAQTLGVSGGVVGVVGVRVPRLAGLPQKKRSLPVMMP